MYDQTLCMFDHPYVHTSFALSLQGAIVIITANISVHFCLERKQEGENRNHHAFYYSQWSDFIMHFLVCKIRSFNLYGRDKCIVFFLD